jgi:SAM-dependent methyltransferase
LAVRALAMRIRLLPYRSLLKTGPVDHADWNYRPLLGWIMGRRFALFRKLLPGDKAGALLEVGYGSGVFMPELARHCNELHGIDVHPHAKEVGQRLAEHGVAAHLQQARVEQLPYSPATFDLVVAISSLEFAADARAAAAEIRRVLKPGGHLIIVTPGHSPLTDWGLKLLTGESAKADYSNRREQLLPALLEHFVIDAQRLAPAVLSKIICLYKGLRLKPAGC